MSKVLSAAALVAAMAGGPVLAQTVADVGQPRELPPAGYTQQQYVDSRGCVFLRAGLGGTVRWVARVGEDRKPLCGAMPTFQQAKQASATLDAQTNEAAPAASAPVMTATAMPDPAVTARVPVVAPAPAMPELAAEDMTAPAMAARQPWPSPITAPRVAIVPPDASTVRPAAPETPLPTAVPAGDRIACFKSAPVLERVALSDGGSALVCTRGDGSLTGWRAPLFPGRPSVGAGLIPPVDRPVPSPAASLVDTGGVRTVPERAAPRVTVSDPAPLQPMPTRVVAQIAVPAGYTPSWKDDRLNPMRGIGTAEGQAEQDRVWTRSVPSEDVLNPPPGRLAAFITRFVPISLPASKPRLTVSSMGEPAGIGGASYIQVGAFGNLGNAQGAAARLAAAGLPVASQQARGLKVILAGPFASANEASQALGTVRAAGFGDAFVR